MSHEVVHTFGSTSYFIFAFLFLWAASVSRTNPGAGWWAASIACVLTARIAMFLLLPLAGQAIAVSIYLAFTVLEKPLLLTGVARFLKLNIGLRKFWLLALAAESWLLLGPLTGLAPLPRSLLDNTANIVFLLVMAWLIYRHSDELPRLPLGYATVATVLLAIHWFTAPILIHAYPAWFRNGFLLGTALVMIQYLSLLAATLSLFQSRLLAAEAQALDLAFRDPLTGLHNKRSLAARFEHVLQFATRPHQQIAVIYIDLDNFKPINDSAGHAVGDEVLKTVAARLQGNTRSTDICARIGGDEFVVIGTQLESAEQAADLAGKVLAQMFNIPACGTTYPLGASIGVALYPVHGKNLTGLLECADKAMYHAKRGGKGGCALYRPDEQSWQAPDGLVLQP